MLIDGDVQWAHGPELSPADHRGAGDSMTAGITAGLDRGLPLGDCVRLGVAAGAVTVSRHGLATGDRRSIESLVAAVTLEPSPRRQPRHESGGGPERYAGNRGRTPMPRWCARAGRRSPR